MSEVTDALPGVGNITNDWQYIYMKLIYMCFKSCGRNILRRFSTAWRKHTGFWEIWGEGCSIHKLLNSSATHITTGRQTRYRRFLECAGNPIMLTLLYDAVSFLRCTDSTWKSIQQFPSHHNRFFHLLWYIVCGFFCFIIRKSIKNKIKIKWKSSWDLKFHDLKIWEYFNVYAPNS